LIYLEAQQRALAGLDVGLVGVEHHGQAKEGAVLREPVVLDHALCV
jgi:hypothetical protein